MQNSKKSMKTCLNISNMVTKFLYKIVTNVPTSFFVSREIFRLIPLSLTRDNCEIKEITNSLLVSHVRNIFCGRL